MIAMDPKLAAADRRAQRLQAAFLANPTPANQQAAEAAHKAYNMQLNAATQRGKGVVPVLVILLVLGALTVFGLPGALVVGLVALVWRCLRRP